MTSTRFITSGGVNIEKSMTPLDDKQALDKIYQYIDTHKGALFVSNYEVPDRYSRWDLGFVHPALELISRKREFEINALNPNGTKLLTLIEPVLKGHPHLKNLNQAETDFQDRSSRCRIFSQRKNGVDNPDFFL